MLEVYPGESRLPLLPAVAWRTVSWVAPPVMAYRVFRLAAPRVLPEGSRAVVIPALLYRMVRSTVPGVTLGLASALELVVAMGEVLP